MSRYKTIFYAYAITLIVLIVPTISLDGQSCGLPLDRKVRVGVLPNGFTYYIRNNNLPSNEIELRLIVKAGNLHEDEDQLELAHVLEHMGFRSLRNFPDGPFKYIEKHGLKKGININASTGEITIYELSIPADNKELLKGSISILRDWADGILLDSAEIEQERNIVLREKGEGLSSAQIERIYAILQHPKYSPAFIGKYLKNLKKFKHESLIRFYKDWYRPDMQAAIIVGNVDVDIIERQIKLLFSNNKIPADLKINRDFSRDYMVQLNGRNQVVKIEADDNSDIRVEFIIKKATDRNTYTSEECLRYKIITQLYNEMIKIRFSSKSEQYNLPFKSISNFVEIKAVRATAGIDALTTYINIDDNKSIEAAVKTVLAWMEQVNRFGFTNDEYSRAKNLIVKELVSNSIPTSKQIVDNYIDHYKTGKSLGHNEYELKNIKQLLSEISINDINKYATQWIERSTDRDIIITAPKNVKGILPSESAVLNWINDIKKGPISKYKTNSVVKELIPTEILNGIKAATIKDSVVMADIGVTEVILSNGVKVVLKPIRNDLQTDRISMVGFSRGGALQYSGIEYYSALSAASVVYKGGAGGLNKFELARTLKGKGVSVSPYITDTERGINGSSTAKDFETMLQLTYLYFHTPNKNGDAFDEWKYNEASYLSEFYIRDRNKFFDSSMRILQEKGFGITKEVLKSLELETIYRIYKKEFASAANFTFVITGNFEVAKIKSLVCKYLGALPYKWRSDEVVKTRQPDKTEFCYVFLRN